MIQATIAGNIGNDAETKQVGQNGDSVTEFNVGCSRKVKGEQQTTWVRCAVWGKRGDSLREFLKKGRFVSVAGELSTRLYDDKNGVTRVSHELRVSELALGPSPVAKADDEDPSRW